MWHVIQASQGLRWVGRKTRPGLRRVDTRQPQHHVGLHRLQCLRAVDGDNLQAHTGVATQQGDQVAPEDVVQDGFGHRQANQGLLLHRQAPFVGQGHQARLQLQAITAQGQDIALVAEQ